MGGVGGVASSGEVSWPKVEKLKELFKHSLSGVLQSVPRGKTFTARPTGSYLLLKLESRCCSNNDQPWVALLITAPGINLAILLTIISARLMND